MIEKRGPTSQAARARAEEQSYTALFWAFVAQFMFLFALDNPHSVKIY